MLIHNDSWQVIEQRSNGGSWSGVPQSLLEELFWHFAGKYDTRHCEIDCQRRVMNYRIDATFEYHGKVIGVELDGKAYHNANRDAVRDDLILTSGEIHEIIRVPFAALNYYPYATLAILETWQPEIFVSDFGRYQSRSVEQIEISLSEIPYGYTAHENEEELDRLTEMYWFDSDCTAYAGSYFSYARSHNVTPIIRKTKR